MRRALADWPEAVRNRPRRGTVVPAHLLALDARRRLNPRRQRALSRYYLDAGAGGLAVGVHATQFAIREAGLYEPVLRLAGEAGSGDRGRPRLSRRALEPWRHEGGERGRADRALPGARSHHPARRILS